MNFIELNDFSKEGEEEESGSQSGIPNYSLFSISDALELLAKQQPIGDFTTGSPLQEEYLLF